MIDDRHLEVTVANDDRPPTRIRWGLVALLFAVGAGLCVAAFLVDGNGWGGLGPSALLNVGIAIGLVGVLLILERSLVREIRRGRADVFVRCFVRKSAEQPGGPWDVWTVARPGDDLDFLIVFENAGNRTLKNVAVGNNLPKHLVYVDGSASLHNDALPSGLSITNDNIVHGGINAGNYEPGAVGYVSFTARVDPMPAYEKVGTYDLRNVVIVRPEGLNEHHNVAKVLLDVRTSEAV